MIEDSIEETQRKIRDLIAKNPGLFAVKIANLLNISISEMNRHLIEMEKNNIITGVKGAGYKQYYLKPNDPSISTDNVQNTKQKIYDLIVEHPGLHLSKIAKFLKMSKPLAEYHLIRMEKNGEITVAKEAHYTRYYINSESIGIRDKKILSLLRKENLLKIALFLANYPNAKHKEISEHLHIPPSTLSYYLDILARNGVIQVHRYGAERGYRVKNEKEFIAFLIKYRLHVVVDGFNELWDSLNFKRW